MWITCECSYHGELDEFLQTPLFGRLPNGEYQCPSCRKSWSRQARGYRIIGDGISRMVVPERIEIVQGEARL